MVDLFALALPHLLMALACWRLLFRDSLDRELPVDPAGPGYAAGPAYADDKVAETGSA